MPATNQSGTFPAAYAVVQRGNGFRLYIEPGRETPVDTLHFSDYFRLPIVHQGVIRNLQQYNYLDKVVNEANENGRKLNFEFLDDVLQGIN